MIFVAQQITVLVIKVSGSQKGSNALMMSCISDSLTRVWHFGLFHSNRTRMPIMIHWEKSKYTNEEGTSQYHRARLFFLWLERQMPKQAGHHYIIGQSLCDWKSNSIHQCLFSLFFLSSLSFFHSLLLSL